MADITSFFGLKNTYFDRYGVNSPRSTTCELTAAAVGKRFVSYAAGTSDTGHATVAQSGAGAEVAGVLDGDGAAGERRRVVHEASAAEVEAGAALTRGQAVQSDATGRAVPHTTGVKAGVTRTSAAVGEYAEIQYSF